MSMDFNGSRTPDGVTSGTDHDTHNESEGSLFAATPVWERGKKKRGGRSFGSAASSGAAGSAMSSPAVTPETSAIGSTPVSNPVTNSEIRHEPYLANHVDTGHTTTPMAAAMTPEPQPAGVAATGMTAHDIAHQHDTTDRPDADGGMVAPIGRTAGARTRTGATTTKRGGAAGRAVALGALGLAVLAGAGWYASQPRDGVPELTPGAAAPTATASAPAGAMMADNTATASTTPAATSSALSSTTSARTTPPATAERRTTTTTTRLASAPRARPAAAASAGEGAIDASGTASLPGGPQPYSAVSGGVNASTNAGSSSDTSAASPATVNPAPAQAAPQVSTPAPATEATPEPAPSEAAPATGAEPTTSGTTVP